MKTRKIILALALFMGAIACSKEEVSSTEREDLSALSKKNQNVLHFPNLVNQFTQQGLTPQPVPVNYVPLTCYADAELYYFANGIEERFVYKYPTAGDIPIVRAGEGDCATGTYEAETDSDGNVTNESCSGAATNCKVGGTLGSHTIICCD